MRRPRATLAASCLAVALGGCAASPPAVPVPAARVPAAAEVVRAEEARAGTTRWVHARGIAELRWRDASGSHFEQGDLDLRWCPGRGIAASISKFGDRHAWIGSDGVRWWRFAPKASPGTLDVGVLSPPAGADRSLPDECSVNPALLGFAPLRPREGAAATVEDGLAWFELDAAGLPSLGRGRAEAAFDPSTLEPREVRLVDDSGATMWRVSYGAFGPMRIPGTDLGSWPRVPTRVEAVRGEAGASLLLVFSSVESDRDAVDRPALYDLEQLRERFAPQAVRVLE